jgi:hypothetical protein
MNGKDEQYLDEQLSVDERGMIPENDWEAFGKSWNDPWPEKTAEDVVDLLRGDVE